MPRIRCPKCGAETARILFGFPDFSEQMKRDIEAHKIYLGGCIISKPSPTRHCYNCDENVCYDFYPVDEAETIAIEFEIGGFHQGFKRLVVERGQEHATATYTPSTISEECDAVLEISLDEYKKYVHKIYMTYIKEWNESYNDPEFLDGTSWAITIKYDGGYEQQWSGCNAYPPLWNRFLKAINSLDLPDVK